MFRNRLAGNVGVLGKPNDRQRTALTESRNYSQARLVAERRKDWRRIGDVPVRYPISYRSRGNMHHAPAACGESHAFHKMVTIWPALPSILRQGLSAWSTQHRSP
jgi:hypothetical protein